MYNYFISYKNYFWTWETEVFSPEETNHIATIVDGQSIAYFSTIIETLEDLEHQGLPPFGAILLALIASNPNIQDASFNSIKLFLLNDNRQNNKTFTNAIEVLEHIKNLPEEYKTGKNKASLFRTLFKDCHNRHGLKNSTNIINASKKKTIYHIGSEPNQSYNDKILEHDIRAIALLIRRFKSPEDIINAINNVPKSKVFDEIKIEERLPTEIDTNKTLLEQITKNKNTYQIGSLVKRIWSGLNIPMHNNLPSSQPLGGVSDITNKGEFSRLLISEYAYDDDTFMSRVVNNEALYIERETPPETNNKQRVFLIDVSLKNWGIPKLLSFATTIAIATHPKSNFAYTAYVIGDTYKEAPLQSLLEIIESQHLLSGTLHCANGLESFINENGEDNTKELFLLTEESNLDNSNLQNAIYSNYSKINYIITTNTNGAINFFKHQNKSRKHFQHILLPYHDIWNSNLPKSVTNKKIKNNDLQIDHILLEPIEKSNCKIIPYKDEIYIIQNFNLYSLTSKGITKGLQLLMEDVPYNNYGQYTIIKNKKKQPILIYLLPSNRELTQINTITKERITVPINTLEFNDAVTLLFSWKNNVILSSKKDFYTITDDLKLNKTDNTGDDYSFALLEYQEKTSIFRCQLKGNKINYNPIKNVDFIDIEYNDYNHFYLSISSFVLAEKKIIPFNTSKYNYTYTDFQFEKNFTPITTLYLKRAGKKPLVIINLLKEIFNLSLKEAKKILDHAPGIIISEYNQDLALKHKDKLENNGATCYIKIDYFKSKDESTIHIKNGQLIFKSSDLKIPQFYITSIINFEIAMATHSEFAGNTYFLPIKNKLTVIALKDFYKKYINLFIKHIIEYED